MSIEIIPIDDCSVRYTGEKMSISKDTQDHIDRYWEELCLEKNNLHRGDVFSVDSYSLAGGNLEAFVSRTDYAHFTYQKKVGDLGADGMVYLTVTVIPETADKYIILGKMSSITMRPGKIQFCGGGVSVEDVTNDTVDTEKAALRELYEELGVKYVPNDRQELVLSFVRIEKEKTKISLVYKAAITQNSEEFLWQYKLYEENVSASSQTAEFSEVILIKKTKEGIASFLQRKDQNISEDVLILLPKLLPNRKEKLFSRNY